MWLGKYVSVFFILLLLPMASLAENSPVGDSVTLSTQSQLTSSISGFQARLSSTQAGHTTDIQFSFDVSASDFIQIRNGSLRLTFPDGFDLTGASVTGITDNSGTSGYEIQDFNLADQSVDIDLKFANSSASVSITSVDTVVTAILSMTGVINPRIVGSYSFSGLLLKQNDAAVAGPALSLPVLVAPAALNSIVVTPGNDTTMKAGNTINFSATGYDEFGNPIPGLTFLWTLEACTNCIGFFVDSTLTATKVGTGVAVAMSGTVEGKSGQITVVAGDLERMVLSIADTQFVGWNLRGAASIILYDHYNNLKRDYNLQINPITLVSSDGQLVPTVLNDNSLQIGGVVRLLSANVKYLGSSAAAVIYATNGSVTSSGITVHFNGYDVIDALDITGQTISHVIAGHEVTVKVPVQNNGNLLPSSLVMLTARYESGEGGTTQESFSGGMFGQLDTLTIGLPVHVSYPAVDTLILELTSHFSADGQSYTVIDTLKAEISVSGPAVFRLVDASFKPDTILSGHSFNIGFDISAQGFNGTIDSAHLLIQMASDSGGIPFATLFDGSPQYTSISGDTITYRNIPATYTDDTLTMPATYIVKVTYHVLSSGNLYVLENEYPDSLVVIPAVSFSYESGSFAPSTVYAGVESSFGFGLNLHSAVPVAYCPSSSDFTLAGTSFNLSTILQVADSTFVPGLNHLQSISLYIPEDQAGGSLSVTSSIRYCVPGIPDTMQFVVPFDSVGLPVNVLELPVVQIISLDVIAPNTPHVNTAQAIRLSCRVANVSGTAVDSAIVRLSSDGLSTFTPDMVLRGLGPGDTAQVIFNVTTGDQPIQAEVFRTEIVSTDIGQVSPIDNIAFITIETPADLNLTYSLLGAGASVIDYATVFELSVALANQGQAEVSDAAYRLILSGFDSDGPDTLTGSLSADKHLDFELVSPNFDTTLTLSFLLTAIPRDLNIDSSAPINDTSFSISIQVISSEGQLFVSATSIGSSLILPGRPKEVFALQLTNSGASPLSDIAINEIEILARNGKGMPVDIRSIVNIGNTGFFENGVKVAMTTASDNRLVFTFDKYILAAGRTRTLSFVVELKSTNVETLSFELAKDQIQATFIAGPNAGQSPEIATDQPGSSILLEALAIKGSSLESSFLVRTNPFNPNDPSQSPVEFSYELASDSKVEFRVFTLTGEKVFATDYPAGAEGGHSGENFVYWDGRNDDGVVVFNGVYIVSIRNVDTDEYARLKVAVIK